MHVFFLFNNGENTFFIARFNRVRNNDGSRIGFGPSARQKCAFNGKCSYILNVAHKTIEDPHISVKMAHKNPIVAHIFHLLAKRIFIPGG